MSKDIRVTLSGHFTEGWDGVPDDLDYNAAQTAYDELLQGKLAARYPEYDVRVETSRPFVIGGETRIRVWHDDEPQYALEESIGDELYALTPTDEEVNSLLAHTEG